MRFRLAYKQFPTAYPTQTFIILTSTLKATNVAASAKQLPSTKSINTLIFILLLKICMS